MLSQRKKKKKQRTMASETSRLIVRNLAPSVDEKQLRAHFNKHGELTDVKTMKKEGKSRCFAFIGFRSEASAKEAKETLDRSYIGSTRIRYEKREIISLITT
jgi:multiple RNA-binding domain-containing protein 1